MSEFPPDDGRGVWRDWRYAGAPAFADDAEKCRAFVAFIKPMLEGK